MPSSLPGAVTALLMLVIGCNQISVAQPISEQTLRIAGDHEYPRTLSVEGGTVTVHHPQIESWDNFETMSGWVVTEIRLSGDDMSWLGSFLVSGKTDVDFDERLVVIHDLEIRDQKFSSGEPPGEVLAIAHEALTARARSVPLDLFIRVLPDDFELPSRGVAKAISAEAPAIYASTTPAALIVINGEPVLASIEKTKLKFVVNTNWDLFYHTPQKRWYVLNEATWQYSDSVASPRWETTTELPRDFDQIPDVANWSRVIQHLPAMAPVEEPPKLIVSQRPAELILVDGKPALERIPGTDIAFVQNTTSNLFVHGSNYYFLVSGRWFTAPQIFGPYKTAPNLPESFLSIPVDHERGHVLASVPGSDEARAAQIEALIPRQAHISKTAGSELRVIYAGDPHFVGIRGTSLKRAANTQSQVIQMDKTYYLCTNGVWFTSVTPFGPWKVSARIPAEIYTIPPSDPAYNTTYVYIVDDDDDTLTYAYTSGYHGAYVTGSTVVFGTGYWYSPYVYYPAYGYPYYYPYPASYGHAAYYNTTTGRYGTQAVAYGPYGGAGSTAVYNPITGNYGRGWSAWDSNEVVRAGYAYNPRKNTYVAGNAYYNASSQEGWRAGYVQRDDNWVYGESSFENDQVSREFETSSGANASQQRTQTGDTVSGSAQLQGDERTVSTTSQVDDSGARLDVTGSEGGSATFAKESGQSGVDISGTTSDGTDFTGTAARTDGGGLATLESEAGGSAAIRRDGTDVTAVGMNSSGEYYAGRNGEIFRPSDGGWQQYDGNRWDSAGANLDRSNLERQRSGRATGMRSFDQFRSQRSASARGGPSRRRLR